MKRTIQFFHPWLSLALVLVVLLPLFCSCKQEPEIDLTFDKKYIMTSMFNEPEETQCYLIFHSDGTGIYQHNYNVSNPVVISFRYIFEGEFVVCLYDSLISGNLSSLNLHDGSVWCGSFYYSKRTLMMRPQNYHFICEDYLDEFPNFGKAPSTEE